VKKKKIEPDLPAFQKVMQCLKKNIKVQLLNKAKKEGWIRDKNRNFSLDRYFFKSSDQTLYMIIETETILPPQKVRFFKWVEKNPVLGEEYVLITQVSYKYYIRHGSEMILMEALM